MKRYNFSLDPNMRWSLFADGSTGFSIEDGEAISKVLQFVGLEFESILGKALVDSHATLAVAHTNDSPVTWRAYNLIFLSSSDNTYLQHIYQFSHELCHFMVSLDVCDSFRWFEETICQIMSWFILERIYEKRDISPCKPLAPGSVRRGRRYRLGYVGIPVFRLGLRMAVRCQGQYEHDGQDGAFDCVSHWWLLVPPSDLW
ncbi:hypothetical protein GMD89_18550 [Pseudoflavonifractor sp. BIOML-A5]|nr:hypothetical protein [Pseudoflavonifractor sp. BIOML-A5]